MTGGKFSGSATGRKVEGEEAEQYRIRVRQRRVGQIMAAVPTSEDDAAYLLDSGQWELAMSNLRYAVRTRGECLEKPVMLTEGTDG